jgi:hypothetical protein
MGVWRSGSASALHAEGLGFDPLVVHFLSFPGDGRLMIFCSRDGVSSNVGWVMCVV